MRAAGEGPDFGQQVVAIQHQVAAIHLRGRGRLAQEQQDRGGKVVAVNLGGDAGLDGAACQIVGEQAAPFAGMAVNAGCADRCARKGKAGEVILGIRLDLAIEVGGPGGQVVGQKGAGGMAVMDRTRGQKDDASHAAANSRIEQATGTVPVQAQETLGIVPFAAAIPAGGVGKGAMDQRIMACQVGGIAQAKAVAAIQPRDRVACPLGCAQDKVADDTRCAGQRDAPQAAGRTWAARSGTGWPSAMARHNSIKGRSRWVLS